MISSGAVANGIGQPVRRKEDFRLLTGRGSFADDIRLSELSGGPMSPAPCGIGPSRSAT
jgi:CO/xanthine dehydrogenase Mo-binding subunit